MPGQGDAQWTNGSTVALPKHQCLKWVWRNTRWLSDVLSRTQVSVLLIKGHRREGAVVRGKDFPREGYNLGRSSQVGRGASE